MFSANGQLIVINKINFAARNLTSNAGLFLLFEIAKVNGFRDCENDSEYSVWEIICETIYRMAKTMLN
jgi:hypothetical protein